MGRRRVGIASLVVRRSIWASVLGQSLTPPPLGLCGLWQPELDGVERPKKPFSLFPRVPPAPSLVHLCPLGPRVLSVGSVPWGRGVVSVGLPELTNINLGLTVREKNPNTPGPAAPTAGCTLREALLSLWTAVVQDLRPRSETAGSPAGCN